MFHMSMFTRCAPVGRPRCPPLSPIFTPRKRIFPTAAALRRRFPTRRPQRSAGTHRGAGIGERLKRSVVVENRAGANGEIAAASVAKAPTDGSVFMLARTVSTTVAAALNRNLPYDVRTDLPRWRRSASIPCCWSCATICRLRTSPSSWFWRAPSRATSTAHRPSRRRHASRAGAVQGPKVDIVHVPYKGGGPAMADLMAGLVDVYFWRPVDGAAVRQGGQDAGTGQTSTTRSAAAPDIPDHRRGWLARLRRRSLRHLSCRQAPPPGQPDRAPPSTPRSASARGRAISSSTSAPTRSSGTLTGVRGLRGSRPAKWSALATGRAEGRVTKGTPAAPFVILTQDASEGSSVPVKDVSGRLAGLHSIAMGH